METVSDLRQLFFLFYIWNHFYPVISPANKTHDSCCSVVSSCEGHLNYLNLMCQLNIQNWLCYPYSAKKTPLEKGNRWKKLKILFYTPLATALVWTQRYPCQPAHLSSLLPPLCIWSLQHIHLRFLFQLLVPNSSSLICYIIKLCCAGKCTSRLLFCWININAKTNSAGTFSLPWSHLSW